MANDVAYSSKSIERIVINTDGKSKSLSCTSDNADKLDSCKDIPKEKEMSKNEKSHPSHEPPGQKV